MSLDTYRPGLRDVIAGETEICTLEEGMQYRGYCIHDLVDESTFLEVSYLLLFDDLPSIEKFADFRSILFEEAVLPDQAAWLLELLPLHVEPVQALHTAVSLIAHFDPQLEDGVEESGQARAVRLMARVPLLIAAIHQLRNGSPLVGVDPDLSYAANLLAMITGGQPNVLRERALDAALIVSAEQEFNPSTYAARVVSSTGTNIYSAVSAALGTLAGQKHGGANRQVLQVFEEISDPDRAEDWVRGIPEERPIPGFGHPVYSDCDPRASILERFCSELADADGHQELEELAEAIERAVWQQRRLPANLDWPLIRLLHYLDIPADLHLPLFVCARLVGWCAHAIEQNRDGDVVRPRARYRGALDLDFVPLRERG